MGKQGMLVIERRPGERVRRRTRSGEVIWVCIPRGCRGRTKLAIAAPPGTEVHREELLAKEERFREDAS